MDYQKAYALLVCTISNAIDEAYKSRIVSPELDNVIQILKKGLDEAEEMYISTGE